MGGIGALDLWLRREEGTGSLSSLHQSGGAGKGVLLGLREKGLGLAL